MDNLHRVRIPSRPRTTSIRDAFELMMRRVFAFRFVSFMPQNIPLIMIEWNNEERERYSNVEKYAYPNVVTISQICSMMSQRLIDVSFNFFILTSRTSFFPRALSGNRTNRTKTSLPRPRLFVFSIALRLRIPRRRRTIDIIAIIGIAEIIIAIEIVEIIEIVGMIQTIWRIRTIRTIRAKRAMRICPAKWFRSQERTTRRSVSRKTDADSGD